MDMGIYVIYKGERVLYVGQSVNIPKRKQFHLWQLRSRRHPNSYLQHVYNKDKDILFKTVEVVEDRSILTTREIHFIKLLAPVCNFMLPDETDSWIFSKERNEKISAGNTGKRKSLQHRENIRLSKLGDKNPLYGKAPWNKGKGEYMEGDKNPFYGRKHTDDTKSIISQKKIIKIDTSKAISLHAQGMSYEMIARKFGVSRKTICRRINNTK